MVNDSSNSVGEYHCLVRRAAYMGPDGLSHDLEFVVSTTDLTTTHIRPRAVLVAQPGRRLDTLLQEQPYPPGTTMDALFKSSEFASNRPGGTMRIDLIEIAYGPFQPISPEASFIGFSIRIDWSDVLVGKGHQWGNCFFSVSSDMDVPPPWGSQDEWRKPAPPGFVPRDTLGEVMYWGGSSASQD